VVQFLSYDGVAVALIHGSLWLCNVHGLKMDNNSNRLTDFICASLGEPTPDVSETLTQYTTIIMYVLTTATV